MKPTVKFKEYIGDSVYAHSDGYGGIVLTTEDEYAVDSIIVLEPEVFQSLVRYAERLNRELSHDPNPS